MLVIKRDGDLEDFDIDKIMTSIINSADDVDFILTRGDIKFLTQQIQENLMLLTSNGRPTSTYEIRGLAYHVLQTCGFKTIVKPYMGVVRPRSGQRKRTQGG
ncbi:MAG: hypothetical protein GX318_05510 [Clostridia bacterium]|nr:hypothetical protein [Clostridia bacterium]